MNSSEPGAHRRKSRGLTALWIAGAAAAAVASLGVNGTLSNWTSAVITNSVNNVATANTVILKETGPGALPATCLSSDAGASNSYTCATINKYGGTGTPLSPGGSQSVSVTMANVGTTSGTLTLKASTACASSGGLTSGKTDACGIVQVKVECPTGTTVFPALGTATLNDFYTAPLPTTVSTLAANATISCTFTVTLPSTASPTYAGQTLSQQLQWTLS